MFENKIGILQGIDVLLLLTGIPFMFTACGEDEVAQKQQKSAVENSVDTYMDSRIDTMKSAKAAV